MQVVEIGKGSKVKYELDKTTGLIKVITIYYPNVLATPYRFLIGCWWKLHKFAGWSRALLISCVSSQLWFHPSYSLWRQWSHGCPDYYAGTLFDPHFYWNNHSLMHSCIKCFMLWNSLVSLWFVQCTLWLTWWIKWITE